MNPSAEDIAKACDKVPAETVFVLPNNKNIVLAAELANDLSRRNIVVIPTHSVPQGITAAINIDQEASVEDNKNNLLSAIGTVTSGSVTYAVRATSIDGFKLKEGDFIGLNEKHIIAKNNNLQDVTLSTVEKLMKEDASTLTLFYGNEVKEDDAMSLQEKLAEKYPDLEVTYHNGGQPLYYYLISIE